MIEAIFTPRSEFAKRHIKEGDPDSLKKARYAALLHRAIGLAIESAFRFGQDLPAGAVVANDHSITGRYYASDVRLDWTPMHAEVMALIDSAYNDTAGDPNTLVVNLEPCDNCQDFIAKRDWGRIERVGFGISREELADRGLVKPHDETIYERVARLDYPFEVFQIQDDELHKAGSVILDHVQRDISTGIVRVDTERLNEALIELNTFG